MNYYINRLKEQKYDVKKWLLEDVIRLFGIMAILRDEDRNLNQKQILKILKEDDKRRVKLREERLYPVYPKMLTDKQIEKKYKKNRKIYEKRLQELEKDQENILISINEIKLLENKLGSCKEELLSNMLFEAKRFLDSARHEIQNDIFYYKKRLSESSSLGKYRVSYIGNFESQRAYLDKLKKEAQEETPKYKSLVEDYQNIINLIMEAK